MSYVVSFDMVCFSVFAVAAASAVVVVTDDLSVARELTSVWVKLRDKQILNFGYGKI